MILGWLRGQSRSLGIDLNSEATLEIEGPNGANDLFSAEVRRQILLQGTLQHERAHWLHFIGTTSGVFHLVVWETQAVAAKELIAELASSLTPDDFPLCKLQFRSPARRLSSKANHILDAWYGLRDLEHWFFGGQFIGVVRGPKRKAFELFSNFLNLWLLDSFPGPDADKYKAEGRYAVPNTFGELRYLAGDGRILGFHQLTEASARLTEHLVMQYFVDVVSRKKSSTPLQIDVSHLLDGIYGHARNRFYEITKRDVDQRSEAILSILLHESLNSPLPPLSPMSMFESPWVQLNPYTRFLSFTHITKDYSIPESLPLTYDDFCRIRVEVRAILLDRGLTVEDSTLALHAKRLFGAFADFAVPKGLYEVLDGRSYPVDYMRHRYLGRLFYDAFSLYESEPAMLTLPGLCYVSNAARFRKLFGPIRPPIHFIQNHGYSPAWEDQAAHAVLLLDTIVNDILFSCMTSTYNQFIKFMHNNIKHVSHQRYTIDALNVALLNAGFTESFAARIVSDFALE